MRGVWNVWHYQPYFFRITESAGILPTCPRQPPRRRSDAISPSSGPRDHRRKRAVDGARGRLLIVSQALDGGLMNAGVDRPTWALRKFAFVHPSWMLADFVERLRGLVPRLGPLLAGMGEDAAHDQVRGKWSVAQNIGHLSDVEELWQERLEDLRQGRKVYTAAVGSRLQELAERHQGRSVEVIVGELEERRSRLVDAMAHAPARLQEATAFHERLQVPMRLVDCAQFYAEHDDHHLLRIRTIRSLLGEGAG